MEASYGRLMATEEKRKMARNSKTLNFSKLDKYTTSTTTRPTSPGHQHWVCTMGLGRSAPLPHTYYQD